MKPNILAVDDEPDVLELLQFNLDQAGFTVHTAEDGHTALKKARSLLPNVILLDLMLPLMDGLEVCRALRHESATKAIPILILTAKGDEIDRVLGFEMGANDYVTKPFSPRELILRVKQLLLRAGQPPEVPESFRVGGLTVDISRHEVRVDEQLVELSAIEFKLLTLLAKYPGRVMSRQQLLREVWEYEGDIRSRTVDTHVLRVRRKLGRAARHLDTIRGVGYRLIEA